MPARACHIAMPLTFLEFGHLTECKEKLIDFLIEHGVLVNTVKCSQCGSDVNINKETLLYRCQKRHIIKDKHKKRICERCTFEKIAKAGTWFSRSNLDVGTACKIVACFLMLRYPRQEDSQEEAGVAKATIVDWFNFCREVNILLYT